MLVNPTTKIPFGVNGVRERRIWEKDENLSLILSGNDL